MMKHKSEKTTGVLKSRLGKAVLFAGACMALSAGSASAGPIDAFIGGSWLEFRFDPPAGSQATGCTANTCSGSVAGNSVFLDAPPWTYSSLVATILTVTDAFIIGDQFDIFDFGNLIGSTSVVAPSGDCGSNPVNCVGVASSGVFNLAAGAHSLTISPNTLASVGAGYFRVDAVAAAVPEPAMLALFATGLAGLGVWRRKKPVG